MLLPISCSAIVLYCKLFGAPSVCCSKTNKSILKIWDSYQQSCCVAGQAAGLRPRPLWGWSRAPQPWQCWSLAAGCWPPESTLSTGCRCPAWIPWGGGTQRSLLASPRRSGHCCLRWWQTGWNSDLNSVAWRERGGKCNLWQIRVIKSYKAFERLHLQCFVSFSGCAQPERAT